MQCQSILGLRCRISDLISGVMILAHGFDGCDGFIAVYNP